MMCVLGIEDTFDWTSCIVKKKQIVEYLDIVKYIVG